MEQVTTQENNSGIDLRFLIWDLLRAARAIAWIGVLLVVLFAAVFGWRAYSSYTPSYTASASFTVTVTNPLYAGIKTYNSAAAEQMALTFPSILSTDLLRSKVQEKLGAASLPGISASVVGNTNIFTLKVTSYDPQLAFDTLNAVIECYPEVADFVVGPTNMTLLDESGLPSAPSNQRSMMPGIKKGALLGALLWAVLVAAVTLSRTTIHDEEELKKLTNMHCLGVIPSAGRRGHGQRPPRTSWPSQILQPEEECGPFVCMTDPAAPTLATGSPL